MKEARITFRIKEEEKEQIEAIALNKDIPLSQLMRELIREAIKEARNDNIS